MMQIQIVGFGKKGQLKIQQTAFMLLAVTLFFMLAGMFFLVIQYNNLKSTATDQEEENTQMLVTRLANSPEFSCQNSFDNAGTNCIDLDKVIVLNQNISKYKGYWGDISNIEIRKVFPKENTVLCTLQNYPNCNSIRIYNEYVNGTYKTNFVSICRKEIDNDKTYDKCELAQLMVAYNEK
jgi:hypothetical protein